MEFNPVAQPQLEPLQRGQARLIGRRASLLIVDARLHGGPAAKECFDELVHATGSSVLPPVDGNGPTIAPIDCCNCIHRGYLSFMPFRPTLRQLEYVVALYDMKHFGRAARHCHVSQPTLSMQISLVEDGLGIPLFHRTSSRVAPTPAGEKLAKGARILLASLEALLGDLSTQAESLGGIIRLGTPPTFGPYFLPRLLPALHEQYPGLQIYVREDSPAVLETAVADGTLDCGLGPSPERHGLAFRQIGSEVIYLGVSMEHAFANRKFVSFHELKGERLLALGRGHRLLENVRHLADVSGARIIEDFEGTSLDAIRQMVSIGMGISLFPELYARAELRQAQDVALVEIADWNERRDVGLYWRDGNSRERHFLALGEAADAAARSLRISAGTA